MDDGVFLHIGMEKEVHSKLKKLPQHANGHGEAECHQRQEERRQVEGQPLIVVQQQYHGKAHGRRQEAVEGMEHSVPPRNDHIEGIDLAQNLRREDEAQNGDFQRRRQFDVQLHLNPAGRIQQQQRQNAEEGAFIASPHDLAYQRHDHQGSQNIKNDKGALMFPKLAVHRFLERFFILSFFMLALLHPRSSKPSCTTELAFPIIF